MGGRGYVDGLLGPAVVVSVGSGLLLTPITTAVTSAVAEDDAGAASGVMNTTKQMGGALGLAALTALAAGGGATDVGGRTDGYARAFGAMAAVLLVVAVVSLLLPRGVGGPARR